MGPLINSKNVGCALRTHQQNGAWDAPYIGLFRASLGLGKCHSSEIGKHRELRNTALDHIMCASVHLIDGYLNNEGP